MRSVCVLTMLLAAVLPAQELRLTARTMLGLPVRVPEGWVATESQDGQQSTILMQSNPKDGNSPALGLVAANLGRPVPPETTAKVWSEQVLGRMLGAARGVTANLLEENDKPGSVFRLYRLNENGKIGNLASFASVTPGKGLLVYLFFMALEKDFAAMSGPVLPLVAFTPLDPKVLTMARGAGERQRLDDLQSQIMGMYQEARQKIVYNMGGGWCYKGQPGCP